MIEIDIPGYKIIQIKHLVLDFNGTLACDGEMLPGVKENLTMLSESIDIHVLTADTFGKVTSEMAGILKDLGFKDVLYSERDMNWSFSVYARK